MLRETFHRAYRAGLSFLIRHGFRKPRLLDRHLPRSGPGGSYTGSPDSSGLPPVVNWYTGLPELGQAEAQTLGSKMASYGTGWVFYKANSRRYKMRTDLCPKCGTACEVEKTENDTFYYPIAEATDAAKRLLNQSKDSYFSGYRSGWNDALSELSKKVSEELKNLDLRLKRY